MVIMTEYEARILLAEHALAYVGVKEGSELHSLLVEKYNQIKPLPRYFEMTVDLPWCAMFVSVIAAMTNMLDIIPAECSCEYMIEGFRKLKRWREDENYKPQIGDICFYDWQDSGIGDDTGEADHVGIVTRVWESSFMVTEGNYSDAVKNRELKVNAQYLRGFGIPDFKGWAERYNESNAPKPSSWAKDAVAWAVENGISDGKRLQQNASREEVLTFLYRYNNTFGGKHESK